jgi:hypothetical protein
VIKSRRMRWTGHIAQTGAIRNAFRILVVETPEETDLDVDERTIL